MDDRERKAAEARSILSNPIFKEAVERVQIYLEEKALECDSDDKDRAHRIIITKKLFRSLTREFQRMIDDAEINRMRVEEIERINPIKRVFNRGF